MTRIQAIAAIAGALLLLAACSPPRSVEALRVLEDVSAGAAPSALKRSTPEPLRETPSYRFEDEDRVADLYWPGGGIAPKAVTVLVPGVVPLGKDDPRLVVFARTLARARFLVFVPDLPRLRALTIGADDAADVSKAVRFIADASGVGRDASVGLVAISYAAGPAILAAMRPDTRASVGFIYAVGPYFDIEAVVTYLTTGHFRRHADAPWQRQEPSGYAKWVFVHSNAARLQNAGDRSTLTAMARRRIGDPGADIADLATTLGPEGRTVFDLIHNTDPDRTPEYIARLPAALRADFEGLDLSSKDFSNLRARLILVHGREDKLIPYTESLALAAAAGGRSTHLYILDSLEHIELELSGLSDLNKAWRAAYLLLNARDTMPAPQGLEPQRAN